MKDHHMFLVSVGAALLAVLIIFGAMAYSMRGEPRPPPAAMEVGGKIIAQDVNGCTWAAASDGSTTLVTNTIKCRDAR